MHKDKEENGVHHQHHHLDTYANSRHRDLDAFENGMLEGDMFLQVKNYIRTHCEHKHFEFTVMQNMIVLQIITRH